jgi:hypothetical protein
MIYVVGMAIWCFLWCKNKDTLEGRRGEYSNQLWAIRILLDFLSYLENNCSFFFSRNITEKTYFVRERERERECIIKNFPLFLSIATTTYTKRSHRLTCSLLQLIITTCIFILRRHKFQVTKKLCKIKFGVVPLNDNNQN